MDEKQREILLKALSEAPAEKQEKEVLADLKEERYERTVVGEDAASSLPKEAEPAGRIVCIDGGNAELIRAPHLSLQLVRLAAITYQGTKRKETQREEFFVIVKSVRDGGLEYEARILRKNTEEMLRFNPTDKRLTIGIKRAEPSLIGGVVRRLFEIRLASDIAALDKGDAVVLDGTLEATYPGERELIADAARAASEHGVTLAGLAKRCSLLTTSGRPLLRMITALAGRGTWQCEFAKGTSAEHDARLFAVRLHPKAKHTFRLDISNKTFNKNTLNSLLAALALHSREATFPGYPYGLIEADKIARVSNQEKRYHLSLLEARLGTDWKILSEAMSSMNAHDILDSM